MLSLDWPSDFVARCPVRLFEAPGGAKSWMFSGMAGEFHMKPLGNAELHFQLRDLLDNQVLFEYTICKPDSFLVLAQRFFAVCLENGSFRGFGFADNAAASDMRKQIENSLQTYYIKKPIYEGLTETPTETLSISASHVHLKATNSTAKRFSKAVTCESVPWCLSRMGKCSKENSGQSFDTTMFTSLRKSGKFYTKWKFMMRGFGSLSPTMKKLSSISQVFGRQDQEMEIGYPTDVKHVAHIGWDGPSIGVPNQIDELKPAYSFSSGPLREFGQPRDVDWIHDALSAANWSAQRRNLNVPPKPPTEFSDPDKAHYKWNVSSAILKCSEKIYGIKRYNAGTINQDPKL